MLTSLLLSFATMCSANELLLPRETTSNNNIYSTAARVANKHFDLHFVTLVYSHGVTRFHDPLRHFFLKYTGVVSSCAMYEEAKQLLFETRTRNKITQYFIEIRHVKDLDCLLKFIKDHKSFRSNGKFILICDNSDDSKEGCDTKLAFGVFWKYSVSNVVILNGHKQKHILISTYFPLSSDQCHSIEPVILETIPNGEEYPGVVNAFPNKFVNFHRCKLFLSTFHLPPFIIINKLKNNVIRLGGSEGPLAHILVDKLNATMQVITPTDGHLFGDFDGVGWTGSLGDVFTKRANMSVASALMTARRAEFFQAAYPHRMCVIGWISPPSRLRPAWEKLVKPFDRTLRICFFTFVLVVFVVLVVLKETRLRHVWSSHFTRDPLAGGLYLETCAVLLGQVGRWRPRHAVLSFALTLWIWFTFIMRSSYQGALIGPLKYDIYEPQFSTLQETIENGFEIGGSQNMATYLADEPDLDHAYKVVNVEKKRLVMENIANGSLKFVYLTTMESLSAFNLRAPKTKQLNVLPQLAIVVPIANYFPRDSPLAETVDAAYGRIVASGFEAKHTADNNVVKTYLSVKRQRSDETQQALSARHMQACFIMMAVGSLAAALSFLVELLWFKWSRRSL